MVDEPLPVTVPGLKAAVTPAGNPLTLNPTLPANPFTAATVTVYVVFPPAITVRLAGVAVSEKSVIARVALAVWLSPPPVPVTVNGNVPAAVPAAVVSVIVDDPLPVTVDGLNTALTPAGNPLTANPTEPAKPLSAETLIVYVVLPPVTAD
jgi:hypothetical protein